MIEPIILPRGRRALELLPVLAALAVYAEGQDRWLLAAPLMSVLIVVWAIRWQPASGFLGALFSGLAGVAIGLAMVSISEPATIAIPPTPSSIIGGGLATLAAYYGVCAAPTASWTAGWVLAAVSLQVARANPALSGVLLLETLLPALLVSQTNWRSRARWTGLAGFMVVLVVAGLALHRGVIRFDGWLLHRMDQLLRDTAQPHGLGMDPMISAEREADANTSERVLMELDGPPPERLRSAVLTRFTAAGDTPTWSDPEFAMKGRARLAPKRLAPPKPPPEQERRHLGVLLTESFYGVVPSPAGTFDLKGSTNRVEAGWIWRTNGPVQTPLVLDRNATEALPPEEVPDKELTALPAEYRTLFAPMAQKIVGDAVTAEEKAARIERFFTANFEYSLHSDLRAKPGDHRNALQLFIEERRPTFCIYFASAMAVMLRSIDVPARVVQGFLPDEYNKLTGRTTVRSWDAHAWVEAYLPEKGRYVRFDPTPATSRDLLLGRHKPHGFLSDTADAVVSFFRRTWLAFKQDPVGYVRSIILSPVNWTIFIALILWRVWTGRNATKRQRRRTAIGTSDPALKTAYARYVKLLAKAQIYPDAGESDEELLARLTKERGATVGESATAFLQVYRRARYGAKPATGSEIDGALRALAETIRTSRPRQAA